MRRASRLLVLLAMGLGTSIQLAAAQEPPLDPVAECAAATPTISGAGVISGTPDDDVIFGSEGDDVIDGGPGDDLICAGAGDDVIAGGSGSDIVDAGEGDDLVEGGSGRDTLGGGPGNDTLRGGTSNDVLDGGDGDDALFGENDNDSLLGGAGVDLCDGGTGRDVEDEACETVVGPLGLPTASDPGGVSGLAITHGVASGDVTAGSAVVWARANRAATLEVEYDVEPGLANLGARRAEATAESDFTARVVLDGLRPDTSYTYRARFRAVAEDGGRLESDSQVGALRTAPEGAASRPISFVYAGNLGGQRYCRREDEGYAIFRAMRGPGADFFVATGDMIHADWDCPAVGPAEEAEWRNVAGDFPAIDSSAVDWTNYGLVREVYLRHWRYNRADLPLQELLRTRPMYVQWDDHEVLNDFGGPWEYWTTGTVERAGYPNLVTAGREAFFAYAPLAREPAEPERIYRAYSRGTDLDLFLLDGRSYRSRNDLSDTAENAKTMLGRGQLEWLKGGLATSRATWKVVSGLALSSPSGTRPSVYGRDGVASGTQPDFSAETGFERELLELLRFLDDRKVRNVVFISSQALFAQTTRHRLDLNGDGDVLEFHQLQAGLLAGRREDPRELDPTLRPTLLYSEGGLFNFGYVRIEQRPDGRAHLLADVRDENGERRPGSLVDLAPR